MKDFNYPSVICEHCIFTDYGFAPVGTGAHNLCEGAGCEAAYESYIEENPDDTRTIEEMF